MNPAAVLVLTNDVLHRKSSMDLDVTNCGPLAKLFVKNNIYIA